jgi:cephalosporin hydroxylase
MVKGHFIYENLIISQHESVGSVFDKLIKQIKPKRILEIGTADGGLTLMLKDLLNDNGLNNSIIRTYDILEQTNLKNKNVNGIEIITKSPFNYPYSDLEYPDEIKEFVQSEGTTLVLCDGGFKINEFILISQFLKVGDVIMAHDYAHDSDVFKKEIENKIWNWHEIQYSDISNACEINNLESYMLDEFKQVVWVCKMKTK